MGKVTINFFTVDAANSEFVVYLVEEGPWDRDLEERLSALQDRIYGAVDATIDGYVAKEHPESSGSKVRIQVDLHNDAPPDAEDLVRRLGDHFRQDRGYATDISKSPYIRGLRIVVNRPGEGRPS